MGHANVYIRKENEAAWDSLEDKSAWVNERLAGRVENVADVPLLAVAPLKPRPMTEALEEEEEPDYEAMGYKYDPLVKLIYDENGEQVPGKVNKQGKIIELL